MSDAELLIIVKTQLDLGGNNYKDAKLTRLITEVKRFFSAAGVTDAYLADEDNADLIALAVDDLYNGRPISDYVKMSLIQAMNTPVEVNNNV